MSGISLLKDDGLMFCIGITLLKLLIGMKREVDPCQTGWDDYDPAVGVRLLSLYGPGGMNNTYR